MRFKSSKTGGYQVFAVSGTNTVSFAIDADDANTQGLLGFAVERSDPTENRRFFMYGFKVFPSVIPHPTKHTTVSTFDHPMQSFVWDDFTAKPGREYEYFFHPLKGQPKNLDRSAAPISIKIRTELDFSDLEHDVFFNRGVASSQAYERKFGNKRPDQLKPEKRKQAEEWLSRKLDDAILKFIQQAQKGDTLLCCFYEFRYRPVADELAAALARKVKVRLIVDAKVNESTDKKGKFHPSFPREDNLSMLKAAGIPRKEVTILRDARTSSIQHNKFMVLLKGAAQTPSEVWTGSTNISEGGIMGQTNVGHWVRNKEIATRFKAYWELLATNPGAEEGDNPSATREKNKAFKKAVEDLGAVPTQIKDLKKGITPVFSPRNGLEVLKMYAQMVDDAKDLSCITLGFRHRQGIQGYVERQHAEESRRFLLAGEKGPAKSEEQAAVHRHQREEQRLQGMGLVSTRAALSMGSGNDRGQAAAEPACQLHPLQVPAHGPAGRGPHRGDGFGEFQPSIDQRK